MSASGSGARTARWGGPNRGWVIRALQTVLASLVVLVLLDVPAWAGAAFSGSTELQADSDVGLELVVTEEQELGRTTEVVVTVPPGFEARGCTAVGWSCTVEGRSMTYSRTPVGELVSSSLFLDVHTATVNGRHVFAVAQSNAEGAGMGFRPAVTVVGGEEPAPEPTPSPSPTPSSDGGGTTASPSPASSPSPTARSGSSTTDAAEASEATDDGGGGTDGSSSAGSTAPRRTQGRSAGTTLQVTPGAPTPQGQADVAGPDVADDPAIAPPQGDHGVDAPTGADASTVVAADGGPTSGRASGGAPWQQWAGGLLLLLGAAVVVGRQWGDRLAGAGTAIADRVRGVGSR